MSAPTMNDQPVTTSTSPDRECSQSHGGDDDAASGRVQEETVCSAAQDGKAPLTKTQMKKLKKKEKWEQIKMQKRKAEKQRRKAKKRACRERGEDTGPSRKLLKCNKMSMSSCKISVVVDCDYDQYMSDKDIKMLVKQIQHSYAANRRAVNPLQFHCCGVSGKTQARLESLGDYKGWDVKFHAPGYLEMFDRTSIVYLSSESPNMLNTLQEDKVYIIGGLVDHNHQKGLCHRLAETKGVAHAQLPLAEFVNMKTRKVLTINHVFEILLRFTETNDWQKAFYTVLPARKGAIPKLEDAGTSLETDPGILSDAESDSDLSKSKDGNKNCVHQTDSVGKHTSSKIGPGDDTSQENIGTSAREENETVSSSSLVSDKVS